MRLGAYAFLILALIELTRASLPFQYSLGRAEAAEALIFAAASLTRPIQEISPEERFSFAGSGILAKQIAAGAPADIFISANRHWIEWLQETADIPVLDKQNPISNRLVIISLKQTKTSNISLQDLARETIRENSRVIIGDPAHVPMGIYTKESLTSLELWDDLSAYVLPANNAAQVIRLLKVRAGNYAIAYKSFAAMDNDLAILNILPETSHERIEYYFLLLNKKGQSAYSKLVSSKNLNIWQKHGFIISEN